MKKERGIILKTTKHSESNLILQVLAQNGSVIHLFASSALKSKRRFGGGILQPTHYLEFQYKPKNQDQLSQCADALLLEEFPQLRTSYEKLELALHLLHLIYRTAKEGLESPELFDLLGNSLKAIETSQHLEILKTHFEVRLLAFHGVLPEIEFAEEFLLLPISQHAQIQLSDLQLRQLRTNLGFSLEGYLS